MTSSSPPRTDPREPAPFGESRSRVLAALLDAGRPLDVTEVARLVGLHVNTARFHLDGLVEAGAADREVERRELDHGGVPRGRHYVRRSARPRNRLSSHVESAQPYRTRVIERTRRPRGVSTAISSPSSFWRSAEPMGDR